MPKQVLLQLSAQQFVVLAAPPLWPGMNFMTIIPHRPA